MDSREEHSQNKCDICDQMDQNKKTCQTKQRMWISVFVLNYYSN
jgi:hypothetical protein